METYSLVLQNKKYPLKAHGKFGCYRIVVTEKVSVPARSEVIVSGKVSEKGILKGDLCIIEPTAKAFESGQSVAKSLIHGKQMLPLKMMSLTNEEQIINEGTTIATASPVMDMTKVKPSVDKCGKDTVPEHLSDLYQRTVDGLTGDQRHQVAKLLSKYSDVFSKNDADLGRSGIIKHKIPTGETHPITQPPRRVPVHMNEEVDNQIADMIEKKVI